MKPLTEIKNEKRVRLTYSKNILDGIDYIDRSTCYELIKSIIPSALKSYTTPYMPIRQLLNFFDIHNGASAKIKEGRRLCELVQCFSTLVDLLDKMNRLDNELVTIAYERYHKFSASELIDNVKWRMEDLLTTVRLFMVEFDKTGLASRLANTEAINGSADGRRVGLCMILFRANTKMEEIVDFLDKVDSLVKNGRNPMTYKA